MGKYQKWRACQLIIINMVIYEGNKNRQWNLCLGQVRKEVTTDLAHEYFRYGLNVF